MKAVKAYRKRKGGKYKIIKYHGDITSEREKQNIIEHVIFVS